MWVCDSTVFTDRLHSWGDSYPQAPVDPVLTRMDAIINQASVTVTTIEKELCLNRHK